MFQERVTEFSNLSRNLTLHLGGESSVRSLIYRYLIKRKGVFRTLSQSVTKVKNNETNGNTKWKLYC